LLRTDARRKLLPGDDLEELYYLSFEFASILLSPGTLEYLLGKGAARGGVLFSGIAP
jgi:hypothetical protein